MGRWWVRKRVVGEEGKERQSWVGDELGGREVSEVGESRGLVMGEVVVGEGRRWVSDTSLLRSLIYSESQTQAPPLASCDRQRSGPRSAGRD